LHLAQHLPMSLQRSSVVPQWKHGQPYWPRTFDMPIILMPGRKRRWLRMMRRRGFMVGWEWIRTCDLWALASLHGGAFVLPALGLFSATPFV
jgi:hypothetical protein